MLLSTSNSEIVADVHKTRIDRFTAVTLLTIVALLSLIELVTAFAFDRTSQVQRREVGQRQALLAAHDSGHGAHIAILGNSLLLDGVDVPVLSAKLAPELTPAPYFVLATLYYDWFFGLKRLYAEGMRTRYVVVGLSPNQLASPRTRGDYSAHYLFQTSDLVDIIRETHMDPTTASGFLLAHYSHYYSTRSVTRGFVMGRLLPSVGELLQQIASGHEPDIDAPALTHAATDRLTALDRLCRDNGAQLIFVVPPTYQRGADTIARIGAGLGISVLVPVSSHELDATYYKPDGFHLNEKGAALFTSRLGEAIARELLK